MKHTLLVLACAVGAVFSRISCGRDIAINATADAPPDPALAVGLPTGLSSTAVAARKAALIAAGTPAIYAEKFAIDAEQQQAWHDADAKKRQQQAPAAGTPAEQEAQAIIDAQKVEGSKLKAPTASQLEERQDAADAAGTAAGRTAGTTTGGNK